MPVTGDWNLTINTQMGTQTPTLTLTEEGGKLSGEMKSPMGNASFSDGTVNGDDLSWEMSFNAMGQSIEITCTAKVEGDNMSGKMATPMGDADFTGTKGG